MITRARWLLGWGLMAGTYLSLAVVRVVAHGDWDGALVYSGAALVTFGFATAVIPFVLPRGGGGEGGEEGDRGGDGPSPPWWPEFEREFWSHVGRGAPGRKSSEGGGARRERVAPGGR
jgi:hypothetical protein